MSARRVLLDECLDWRLSRHLTGHEVKSVRQMGWSSLKNGALLRRAENQFDVFVTMDRNLPEQQNLAAFQIAVIVLRARSNRLRDILTLVPALRDRIAKAHLGTVTHV